MPNITTKDLITLVRDQATAIQGASSTLADLTVGSILRAVVEANSAVVLWLQGLILQLLAATRAATASGEDLDTWVADYGLTRLPAAAASGQVTFSRFTAAQQAVIPVGAQVQSADGAQSYHVTLDTANPNYNTALDSYLLAVGNTSLTLPVQADQPGAAANAAIGQINTLIQAVPGIDTVANAAALTNGVDAESDTALRARFVAYLASLSKATKDAVGYAITSLQQGIRYTLTENQQYGGTTQMGYFYVVVDDGTGYPSTTLLSSVSNAIDAVRPVCASFGVFAPVVVSADLSLTLATAAGYDHNAVIATVVAALTDYVNSLDLGQPLTYSRLVQVAYDASPGVDNVTGVTLNGGTADVTATTQQVVKTGTVTVA